MGRRAKWIDSENAVSFAWYDIIGSIGVGVIVPTYVLLQAERVRSD